MPATYTYNDAIDDAKRAIGDEINHKLVPLNDTAAAPYVDLLMDVWRRLERLKRPSRRKRSKPGPGQGQYLKEK